jgi:hypothetical protein
MALEMDGLLRVTKLPHISLVCFSIWEIGEKGREEEGRGKYIEKLSRNRDPGLGLAGRNMPGDLSSGVLRGRSIGICSLLGGRGSRLLRASRRDRRLLLR